MQESEQLVSQLADRVHSLEMRVAELISVLSLLPQVRELTDDDMIAAQENAIRITPAQIERSGRRVPQMLGLALKQIRP
jgi:hypothetical protein